MSAVDTELDVYVRKDVLIEVHRYPYAITVQRFACTIDYEPRIFSRSRIQPRKSRRVVDWTIPALFAIGAAWCAWMVLS